MIKYVDVARVWLNEWMSEWIHPLGRAWNWMKPISIEKCQRRITARNYKMI